MGPAISSSSGLMCWHRISTIGTSSTPMTLTGSRFAKPMVGRPAFRLKSPPTRCRLNADFGVFSRPRDLLFRSGCLS